MMSRPTFYFGITLAVVGLVFSVIARGPVHAGPLTGSAGTAPFTKLGVYQGVVSVVSSGTNAGLELGNLGRDIADTSDIYFRPGAVARTNGVKISRNGNTADIYLNGKLCLYQHVGNIIQNPGSPDCRDVWPGGGAGVSNWNLISNIPDFFFGSNGNFLQPKSLNYGVHIGSVASPITGGTAISLNGNGNNDLNVVNMGTGAAITTQGKFEFDQQAIIYGGLYINGQEAYYRASSGGACDVVNFPGYCNEGVGSGLDADLLNGNNVTLENATSCADDHYPRAACLCFNIYRAGSFTKHCAAFDNE